MLLMPYLKHTAKISFPFGVALIVAANLLVFFGFQQRDAGRYLNAYDYYQNSILIRLEPRAYKDYLRQQGQDKQRVKFERAELRSDQGTMLRAMEDDARFMTALRSGQIIRPDHADYDQWLQARRYYDGVKDSITVEKYAFRTERPSLLTAFSHQFLHADLGHLAGNMVTFILIAPAVEAILGTPLFLMVYLIGGLGAAGMHWLVVGSGGGLIGASGAISAAMGAFAALFRWRRIPFFYFIVVYFDIIRAPALLALPIWLINEALQLFWFGDRSVAYGAHIGGFLAGGLLAWPFAGRVAARLATDRPAKPDEAPVETVAASGQRHLSRGRRLMREHRFDEARQAYAQAAPCFGTDCSILRECFNVTKLSPGSKEFHRVARSILSKPDDAGESHNLVLDVFREYIQLAQPRPGLEADVLAGLGRRFVRRGCIPELDRVARLLHRLAPAHPQCREILLAAASGQYEAGDAAKAAELTGFAGSPG